MPELSAEIDAVAGPVRETVAPAPFAETLPEMLHVWAVAAKLTAVILLPLTVTVCEGGLKVKPAFEGVIV